MIVRVKGEEQPTILHMAGRRTDVLTRKAERPRRWSSSKTTSATCKRP